MDGTWRDERSFSLIPRNESGNSLVAMLESWLSLASDVSESESACALELDSESMTGLSRKTVLLRGCLREETRGTELYNEWRRGRRLGEVVEGMAGGTSVRGSCEGEVSSGEGLV